MCFTEMFDCNDAALPHCNQPSIHLMGINRTLKSVLFETTIYLSLPLTEIFYFFFQKLCLEYKIIFVLFVSAVNSNPTSQKQG